MGCPVKFRNERDRLQSGVEKNKALVWMTERHIQIAGVYNKIEQRQSLSSDDVQLLEEVVHLTLCVVYHDWAETDYLIERSKDE